MKFQRLAALITGPKTPAPWRTARRCPKTPRSPRRAASHLGCLNVEDTQKHGNEKWEYSVFSSSTDKMLVSSFIMAKTVFKYGLHEISNPQKKSTLVLLVWWIHFPLFEVKKHSALTARYGRFVWRILERQAVTSGDGEKCGCLQPLKSMEIQLKGF